MRLIDVQNSNQGHGRKVAMITLNVNELALLQGMASELGETLPRRGPTLRLRAVARQMSKEMKEAVVELERAGDTKSKLVYPHDNKAVL